MVANVYLPKPNRLGAECGGSWNLLILHKQTLNVGWPSTTDKLIYITLKKHSFPSIVIVTIKSLRFAQALLYINMPPTGKSVFQVSS